MSAVAERDSSLRMESLVDCSHDVLTLDRDRGPRYNSGITQLLNHLLNFRIPPFPGCFNTLIPDQNGYRFPRDVLKLLFIYTIAFD